MTVLPDVLQPGLRIVFCGTAVGSQAARIGAYYAGRGNQFWGVLARVGLTPRQLAPREFTELPKYGVGLTDLAKFVSGTDSDVASSSYDIEGLRGKIAKIEPRTLAFNGKRAAEAFLSCAASYGRQPESIGATVIFVLPSTSGAARGFWDESHWRDLASYATVDVARST